MMTAGAAADVPSGELMHLVADGLKESGFEVHMPDCEDGCRLTVERWGSPCELSVSDSGVVIWDCVPRAGDEADPKLTADVATFLLTGSDETQVRHGGEVDARGMTFLGIAGNMLRARGFDVGLEIYEDNQRLEVAADIMVKKPLLHPNANVHISDDGGILWECDYPYEVAAITDSPKYFAALANTRELAESIVTRVAQAISLSSGVPAGDQ